MNRVKKTAVKKIHVKTARFAGIQFRPWQGSDGAALALFPHQHLRQHMFHEISKDWLFGGS